MKVSAFGRLYFMSCGIIVGCAETIEYPYLVEIEEGIHEEVNQHREDLGLEPLVLMDSFSDVARDHSAIMAEAGSLDHGDFESRAQALSLDSPDLRRVGENLGVVNHNDLIESIVYDWAASPEHAVNLTGAFEETGVGAYEAYDGSIYITQIYLGFDS